MPETAAQLLDRLLERRYEDIVTPVLNSITAGMDSPTVRRLYRALETELAALRAAGLPLDANNPALRALTAELDRQIALQAAGLTASADNLIASGIEVAEDAIPGLSIAYGADAAAVAQVMAGWGVVSADAIRQLVQYTTSPAWADALLSLRKSAVQTVNNAIIRGFVGGLNPLTVARHVAELQAGLTRTQANTLLRTTYLNSYREATAANYRANRDVIKRTIRIAALDDRTCPVCVALHGTEIPVGQAVESHHQCRCSSVAEMDGIPLDIGPTGEQWFDGLPEARQRAILGPGKHDLYRTGQIRLGDLVGRHEDALYGPMLHTVPLRELQEAQP